MSSPPALFFFCCFKTDSSFEEKFSFLKGKYKEWELISKDNKLYKCIQETQVHSVLGGTKTKKEK